MDMLLLGITVVSLIVAFVMSMAAMRLMRDEKNRSSARVAALSLAAGVGGEQTARVLESKVSELQDYSKELPKPAPKAPWSAPPATLRPAQAAPVASLRTLASPAELPLNEARVQPEPVAT